jgi:peroxin-5
MGIYGMNMGPNIFGGLNSNYNVASNQGKGKGKTRDADFEAAFAQVAASLPPVQAETSRIVEVDSGVTDIEAALRSTTLEAVQDLVQDGGSTEHGPDFQRCGLTRRRSN